MAVHCSFSQIRAELKLKSAFDCNPDDCFPLQGWFQTDARTNDSFETSIVSHLFRSWKSISNHRVFVFVNREGTTAKVGIGHVISRDAPTFILGEFDDNSVRVSMSPRVLLSTSIADWPRMRISVYEPGEESIDIMDALHTSWIGLDPSHEVPPCISSKDTGITRDAYMKAVEECKVKMTSGELDKIVLSRRVTYNMATAVNPCALLLQVMQRTHSTDAGKRYIALYTSGDDETFISLTPERLCRVEQNTLETEALAGTCPGASFNMTDKLDEEHGVVSRYLSEKLETLGPVTMKTRDIITLKNMSHCRQKFSVSTSTSTDLIGWSVSNLHPTPAVGGLPLNTARELIRSYEPNHRGFFAGPMGMYDPETNTGELCVAIRSAVIRKNQVDVLAGAGLVADSDPQAEWEEMELKMSQFKSVLLESNRRIFSLSKLPPTNPTELQCMFIIEELVRQNVTHFIVCPGSRSTPLTIAVRQNSVAHSRSVIVHDERCAGFLAVGVARAGGLAAIIVTSGTACANLLPAVCEAHEANLPIVLLTADRPSRSWNVGEYQTVKQTGMFTHYIGFEKSFAQSCLVSELSDVSFAVGDVAKIRKRVVHFNFEFEKSELQPGSSEYRYSLHPRLAHYITHQDVLTEYVHDSEGVKIPTLVLKQIVESISHQRAVIVAGELSDPNEAIALNFFIHRFHVPCIAEPLSLMPASNHVLLNPDQLVGNEALVQILNRNTDLIIRVGGPLISGRLQEWASSLRTVRVVNDGFRTGRHDPQYAAETYIHSRLDTFLIQVDLSIGKNKTVSRGVSPERNYEMVSRSHPVTAMSERVRNLYIQSLADDWHEGQIAKILGIIANEKKSAVFLSASMPCRDFSIFGSLFDTNSVYRLVAANRGANGIDGVISAATGYASASGLTTYVLIGDVATLHDLSGLALGLNVHPGSDRQERPDVRIVCVNNAGGAIFSFLPIRNYNEVFTPYFDTPHALEFFGIANVMRPETAVSVRTNRELEIALRDDSKKFIECVGLPSHEDNVTIHKKIGAAVSQSLVSMFI